MKFIKDKIKFYREKSDDFSQNSEFPILNTL